MLELYTYSIAITLFVYCCFVLYLIIGWLNNKRSASPKIDCNQISIIIPFRNEQDNILFCLKSISELNYPKDLLEVILVSDHSNDSSVEIITEFIKSQSNYSLIELSDEHGKKAALKTGIKAASYEYIQTIDADCTVCKNWLNFDIEQSDSMLARPVLFYHKNLFEKIQALDFLSLTGTMFSTFGNKSPILCNGANLLFRKEEFVQIGGYTKIDESPSGDDILLMQKFLENKLNVRGDLSTESVVYTSPNRTLSEFFSQRIRWASKIGKFQSSLSKYIGLIIFLINFSLLVSLALSFVNSELVEFFVVPFVLKCVIDFLFLFLVASYFEERRLLWYLIITELFNMVTVPIIAILSSTKKYTWKGRQY